jgi:hypothetical protein
VKSVLYFLGGRRIFSREESGKVSSGGKVNRWKVLDIIRGEG